MRLNANGFPLETCRRCNGEGRLPVYSPVLNGVCFGCGGSKVAYPQGTPAKLAAEWTDIRQRTLAPSASAWITTAQDGTQTLEIGVAPGDVVRPTPDSEWRTIATVNATETPVSWNLAGEPRSYEIEVTFTDGSTATGPQWGWSRRMTADALAVRDALAERARTAYARTLARRARTARTPAPATDETAALIAKATAEKEARKAEIAAAGYRAQVVLAKSYDRITMTVEPSPDGYTWMVVAAESRVLSPTREERRGVKQERFASLDDARAYANRRFKSLTAEGYRRTR